MSILLEVHILLQNFKWLLLILS